MAPVTERVPDDRGLQACIRDLVALSAMPAWWAGRPPGVIADSLRDLLITMLNANMVIVHLRDRLAEWSPAAATGGQAKGSGEPDGDPNRDPHRDPHRELTTAASAGAGAGLRVTSLPIGLEGEMGRVEVGAARPNFPEKLELLLMRVAVNQVASALQHARLIVRHERAERLLAHRASQQAVVAHLGLRALRESPVDPVQSEAVAAVRRTFNADHAEIFELASEGRALVLRAAAGWPEGMLGSALGVTEQSVPGRVMLASSPIVVRHLQRDARFTAPSALHDLGVVSGASVLVHGPQGPFGVLGVHVDHEREFTDDDVHFLQSVSNLLAAAHERRRTEVEREMLLARAAAAQAEAEQASRVKSEFLGMMSHELRTPLNAIGGYVNLLEEGVRGSITPEQRADLGRIRRSQRHLLDVIDNVLGFLQLGSGRVHYDIQDVAVGEIILAAEELTRPLIAAKQLRYAHHDIGDAPHVRADRRKLEQILVNLLSNATKFTEPGGRIDVYYAGDEVTIRLRVADSGCGIPPDRLESVFEPFIQVRNARRSAEGSGLGLAISRDFARGMGGDLTVESEVGRGSTFTVALARAQ
jgi:signal transduction histidine kinase